MAVADVVFLEVERKGRRPRYHQGARISEGTVAKPEQCNLDQVAATVNELDRLPDLDSMARPWAQLCRRCFRGSFVLAAALELQAAWQRARAARKAG